MLTRDEKLELRRQTGYEATSGANDRIIDWLLQGFDDLIAYLPKLDSAQRVERARLIWESLGDLEERRGRGIFDGSYTWSHYGERRTPPFPAAFLRHLNNAAWVPDADGELVPPGFVEFETLGWKPGPFLLTKIAFKPPIIDQLAQATGIDPAILDLLRRDPAIVAELVARLSRTNQEPDSPGDAEEDVSSDSDVYGDAQDLYGDDMPYIPPGTPDPDGGDVVGNAGWRDGQGRTGTRAPRGVGGQGNGDLPTGSIPYGSAGDKRSGSGNSHRKRGAGQAGGRQFVSYVGVNLDDDGADPDGLDHAVRMQIEGCAIDLIIGIEPTLCRTADGNPGFDLYEVDSRGRETRWVEVKSMMGSLEDRPVGLSHTQFDYAREKGEAYWLYVVEYATDPLQARVLRIQNPAGHARTFTFDQGWAEIALTERPTEISP